MPEHWDPEDKTWEGDMFPVKRTDSLRAWEKMIAWENDSQHHPSNHEVVTVTDLEVGDMVHWYDYHEAYDGGPDEAGEVGDPYPEFSIENTGLVIKVQVGEQRSAALIQQVSSTHWLNYPNDSQSFVRLIDRSRQGMDPR